MVIALWALVLTHSCNDLPDELKNKLQNPETTVRFLIKVDDDEFVLEGRGSSRL